MEDNTYNNEDAIDGWAYVEIFGHAKVAGRISTRKFGTAVMFQIDIPKGDKGFSHSELYPPASIFSIKPTTEEWCRKFTSFQHTTSHCVLPYIPETKKMLGDGYYNPEDVDLNMEDPDDEE